jgi:hypothetical protein
MQLHNVQQYRRYCSMGRYDKVVYYFDASFAPNIINDGAVHAACGGHNDIIRFLLPYLTDYDHITYMACRYMRDSTLRLILDYNPPGINWTECLSIAMAQSHIRYQRICSMLLDHIEHHNTGYIAWNVVLQYVHGAAYIDNLKRIMRLDPAYEISWNQILLNTCQYKPRVSVVRFAIENGATNCTHAAQQHGLYTSVYQTEYARILKLLYDHGAHILVNHITPNLLMALINVGMSYDVLKYNCAHLSDVFTRIDAMKKSQYIVVDHVLQLPHALTHIIISYIPVYLTL